MPTYEYACRECDEHLEVVQSFKDDALTDCPACGSDGALRKVFSAAGIIFKGSGWHIKDYGTSKSQGAAASGAAGDDAGGGDGSSADSSSDSSSSSSDSSSDTGSSEAKSA